MELVKVTKYSIPTKSNELDTIRKSRPYSALRELFSLISQKSIGTEYRISGYMKDDPITEWDNNSYVSPGIECKIYTSESSETIKIENAGQVKMTLGKLCENLDGLEKKLANHIRNSDGIISATIERLYLTAENESDRCDSREHKTMNIILNSDSINYDIETANQDEDYIGLSTLKIIPKTSLKISERDRVIELLSYLLEKNYQINNMDKSFSQTFKKKTQRGLLKRMFSKTIDYEDIEIPDIPKKLTNKNIKEFLPKYLVLMDRLNMYIDRSTKEINKDLAHVIDLKDKVADYKSTMDDLEEKINVDNGRFTTLRQEYLGMKDRDNNPDALRVESELFKLKTRIDSNEEKKNEIEIKYTNSRETMMVAEHTVGIKRESQEQNKALLKKMSENLKEINYFIREEQGLKDSEEILEAVTDVSNTLKRLKK